MNRHRSVSAILSIIRAFWFIAGRALWDLKWACTKIKKTAARFKVTKMLKMVDFLTEFNPGC